MHGDCFPLFEPQAGTHIGCTSVRHQELGMAGEDTERTARPGNQSLGATTRFARLGGLVER